MDRMRMLEAHTGCASTNRRTSAMAASDSALVSNIFKSRSSPVFLLINCQGLEDSYWAACNQVQRALTITMACR